MNFSGNTDTGTESELRRASAGAVLAREAGVPFHPPLGNASRFDPIAEWLSLMEVVQMLCPVWPAHEGTMQGDYWRL
jgi:hypothetical protein